MKAAQDIRVDKPTSAVFRLPESLLEPIVPELLNFVQAFPWDFNCEYEPAESKEAILLKLSEATRKQLISQHIDVPLASDKRNIRLPRGFGAAISKIITDHLVQSGLMRSATISGALIYPPGGWMGWHTNSDSVGWRLYINYTRTDDRSFFRWSERGHVRTDYDKAGFNFRVFRVGSGNDLLWHCIYADDWRLSLGYRLHELNPNWPGAL